MKSLRACILSIPRISLIQTRLYAISVLSNRSAFFNPVDPRVKAHRYVRFLHSTRFSPEPLGSDSLLSNPEEEVNPATEVQVRNSSDTTWISATSSVSTDKTLGADGRILSGLVIEPSELPLSCPGCGAYSQLSAADEPGYYSAERNDVQLWLAKQKDVKSSEDEEVEIVARSLASIDSTLLGSFGISEPDPTPKQKVASTTPICGRCHALVHQHDLRQKSIIHPSLDVVRALLEESPHKRNHIYHVLDSADFPMSLIPQISKFFDIAMRSRNRRARSTTWTGGQTNEMSFIITRADLIARSQEELEKMMPYLQNVLRDALGKYGENVRLGNLWAVSARHSWWTKALKEEVYKRGGGGWLVGKVNVGKSALYEAMFPKGYKSDTEPPNGKEVSEIEIGLDDPNSLLPPLPQEEKYPRMPTVSQLPGTTALPVRNAFGNSRGELVDLPGLPRDGVYEAVNPQTAPLLYHGHRISATQFTLQAGTSLVISNLIQIKPLDDSLIILAAPFVPLRCSVRDNKFATTILDQTRLATSTENIARNTAAPETANSIASAGTFKLSHNVTKVRAGPLTRRDAAGLSTSILPFQIFGADILIEGVGWVELTCQVRKRYLEELDDPDWAPRVEVYSPNGKYIGIRQPMNAFLRFGDHPKPKSQRTARPRRSMRGVKKEEKRKARETRARERSIATGSGID